MLCRICIGPEKTPFPRWKYIISIVYIWDEVNVNWELKGLPSDVVTEDIQAIRWPSCPTPHKKRIILIQISYDLLFIWHGMPKTPGSRWRSVRSFQDFGRDQLYHIFLHWTNPSRKIILCVCVFFFTRKWTDYVIASFFCGFWKTKGRASWDSLGAPYRSPN